MKVTLAATIALLATSVFAGAAAGSAGDILIPGENLFTESITSSADGTIYIGSVGARAIFRALPGAGTAEMWIAPGAHELTTVYGVFADDRSQTLWVCTRADSSTGTPSALHAFDVANAQPRGRWVLPTPGAFCNDIAVGSDGTVYATDTGNMQIVRLSPGAQTLEVWSAHEMFGPKGGVLDGIAVVDGRVVVNTLSTGKLFSVEIIEGGAAGRPVEVQLNRALDRPDGQRSYGGNGLLLVESGGIGRLSQVVFSSDQRTATVTTLAENFPGGPVAVTAVGEVAFVIEAQFKAKQSADSTLLPRAYRAIAVRL